MKLRHVRAVAVFVGVVVALTGARHSSGAGCSGHSSNSDSSSHSSTGGSGSHHDDDDDSLPGGGGVPETTLGQSTQDVTIKECRVEDQGLVADVRATNSSTTATNDYMIEVVFKDASGTTVATEHSGLFGVAPGASDSVLVTAAGTTVTDGTCELGEAQAVSAS
ncbi:hypothetical protein DI272_20320 [Streptomyces sp. Act143]|uniref:hypothetical protein n=1 Tax=Streptomyces sp. Act143 TaxID=2200760 RepID=UPI000D67F91A|nr:hypothetical protein [Streptomyces sp. Act143]PWI16249.1 hypothetical protein DI272_20320 [Streptomyces sp. Act143]